MIALLDAARFVHIGQIAGYAFHVARAKGFAACVFGRGERGARFTLARHHLGIDRLIVMSQTQGKTVGLAAHILPIGRVKVARRLRQTRAQTVQARCLRTECHGEFGFLRD